MRALAPVGRRIAAIFGRLYDKIPTSCIGAQSLC